MKKMSTLELVLVTIIATTLGTGMHFVHHVSFFNHFMGYIFPINECVWEHMKMYFYPLLLCSIYMCATRKDIKAIAGMNLASFAAIPTSIALFYAYWIFTRHSLLIVDVITYVVVMVAAVYCGNKWTFNAKVQKNWVWIVVATVALALIIAFLAYHPYDINLFYVEEEIAEHVH